MATDIAKIGFAVETSQLEKGISALSTFSTSAKSANSNAQAIGTAMNKAAVTFAGAVAGMSRSIASLVSATKTATVEEVAAAKEASDFANSIYRAAQAQDTLTTSTQKTTRSLQNMYSAMLKAASSESILDRINRVTGVTGLDNRSAKISAYDMKRGSTKEEWEAAIGGTPRDMMPNRFNTANIAAQFQDIGVTAAMGMNPMLVALQQGTQLAAVLNSMEQPVKGLADAFRQIINPVSMVSIGLTALAVALIQLVDWTSVAQTGLNTLADGMDFAADAFNFLAENADVLLVGLSSLSAGFAIFNTGSLISGFKSLGSAIVSAGSAAYEAGKAAYSGFTQWLKGLNPVTLKITALVLAVTAVYVAFKTFKDEITAFFQSDLGQLITDVINNMIGSFVGAFEAIADGATWLWEKIKATWNGTDGPADGLMERMNNTFQAATERDYVESIAKAAGEAGKVVDDLASSGLEAVGNLFNKGAEAARNFANSLGETDKAAKKAKEAWANMRREMEQTIAGMELEGKMIGLGTYDTTRLQTRFDLTNRAIEAGITLTPDKIQVIEDIADKTGKYAEENEKLTDSFNFAKDATNSFFSDMREGLRDGQSLWESFGNAVTNVLDKILDKIMNIGVDYLFDALGGMGTKGGETSFSWGNIASSIGGFFGGGTSASTPAPAAKGGAFTNGVYSSPTLFKFANGGQFGVMGEAGPEAVMPLRRGSDGSLGVDAEGIGGNNVVVNVINNSNAQASVNQRETRQGTEIDVLIDQTVAQKMTQQGSYSNNALNAYSNRRLVMR